MISPVTSCRSNCSSTSLRSFSVEDCLRPALSVQFTARALRVMAITGCFPVKSPGGGHVSRAAFREPYRLAFVTQTYAARRLRQCLVHVPRHDGAVPRRRRGREGRLSCRAWRLPELPHDERTRTLDRRTRVGGGFW